MKPRSNFRRLRRLRRLRPSLRPLDREALQAELRRSLRPHWLARILALDRA